MGATCCAQQSANDEAKEMKFDESPPVTPSQKALARKKSESQLSKGKLNQDRSTSNLSSKLIDQVIEAEKKQAVNFQENHVVLSEENKTIEKP